MEEHTLATWWDELTHLKRPWCWERLKARGEGDDRGWDGWTTSPTQWTWVWVNSGSWWWTGRPGVLQSVGLQRVGHDWTELMGELTHSWTSSFIQHLPNVFHTPGISRPLGARQWTDRGSLLSGVPDGPKGADGRAHSPIWRGDVMVLITEVRTSHCDPAPQ